MGFNRRRRPTERGSGAKLPGNNRKPSMSALGQKRTLLSSMLPRSGEGCDRIAHGYHRDSKTIFLYGGGFLLCGN